MQFAICVYETPAEQSRRDDPKDAPAYWGPWFAYSQALNEAGISVGGAGLQPARTATSVRVRDGKRLVQDGPFADTKELLGGFFLIEVPTLDKALEWAARCPAASTGAVEVRPVMAPPPTR